MFTRIPKPAHNLGQPYALYNGADYIRDYNNPSNAREYNARPRPPRDPDDMEHHIRLSIELKSIRLDTIPTCPALFLRYSHPLFASSPPIATHPPATIKPQIELTLPNSFCLFEFPMKLKNLLSSIESTPLPVEAVDISKGTEEIVGVAAVHISEVMKTRPTTSEAGGVLFVWENYVPIHSYDPNSDEPRVIGYVRTMMTLEDRGGIYREGEGGDETRGGGGGGGDDHMHQHAVQEGFAAALELDLWLRAEQQKYKEELIETEKNVLEDIEAEWRRMIQSRESDFKSSEDEYLKVKLKLEESEKEIREREKKVEMVDYESSKRMEALKVEYERKMMDANEAIERMKDDFAHKAEAERRKREAMSSTNKMLSDELTSSERKLKHTEDDLLEFRKRMENSPSALLQAELTSLSAEKIDLQRKLDQTSGSSKVTRQKLLKAYQELSRLKNQSLAATQARIQREHEELEALRVHALAHQQNKLLHGEREELLGLKKEIHKLKRTELNEGYDEEDEEHEEEEDEEDEEEEEKIEKPKIEQQKNTSPPHGEINIPENASENEIRLRKEIARLTQERDTLLNTNLYTHDDRVIIIIQRAIDLQTQRLRDELLKKEAVKWPAAVKESAESSKPAKNSKNSKISKPTGPKMAAKKPATSRLKQPAKHPSR